MISLRGKEHEKSRKDATSKKWSSKLTRLVGRGEQNKPEPATSCYKEYGWVEEGTPPSTKGLANSTGGERVNDVTTPSMFCKREGQQGMQVTN